MKLRTFIERPVLSAVISIVIVFMGIIVFRNSSRQTRPLSPCLQRCKTNGRAAQKAALPFCLNFCARRAPYDVVPPPT